MKEFRLSHKIFKQFTFQIRHQRTLNSESHKTREKTSLIEEYLSSTPKQIVVVDIKMPFLSMVWFMVKWALASIPALLILGIISFLSIALFGSLVYSILNLFPINIPTMPYPPLIPGP